MEYKALAFLEEVAATIELSFDDTDGTLDVVMKNSDGEQVASGSVTVNAWKSPVISATATVDGGTGTPSVEVVKSGTADSTTFTFEFHNLKGADGQAATPAELYWHILHVEGTVELSVGTAEANISFQVLSASSTPYTLTTLESYLDSCGVVSLETALTGTGDKDVSSSRGDGGLYVYVSSGSLTISSGGVGVPFRSATVTDTVVNLLGTAANAIQASEDKA